MYVSLTEDGRIGATTEYEEYASEDMFEFDFPEDFDFAKQDEYKVVEGELVHDPRPIPIDQQIQTLKSQLAQSDYAVIKVYEAMVTGDALPDDEAERYAEIITQRREWRSQINQLEAEAENQNGS